MHNPLQTLSGQLEEAIFLLKQMTQENHPAIISFNKIADHLVSVLKSGGKILICGNGGSLCDAMHFAEELTGRYRLDRPPIKAIAFSDSAHITCTANDYGNDYIFSRLVQSYGNRGDVLICLSTSGRSPNINQAIEAAKKLGISTVGFTGKSGGDLKKVADYNLHVESSLSERIQEVHMFFLHCLVEEIERRLYPELYASS